MPRIRRFLLLAVFLVLTVYYFASIRHTGVPNLDTSGTSRPDLINPNKPIEPVDEVESLKPVDRVSAELPADERYGAEEPQVLDKTSTSTSTTPTKKPTPPAVKDTEVERPSHNDAKIKDEEEELNLQQSTRPKKPKVHWRPSKEHFPVLASKLIKLPAAGAEALPKIQHNFAVESWTDKAARVKKQTIIRESFQHAWTGYAENAMPHDELKPLSKGYADPFNGWGATLVDTLDTLWIMGLYDEFEKAVDVVGKIDFTTSIKQQIPLFETVIRYLGGLIAAHDLTDNKYPVLLKKAVELAEVLMGAFDTPNRMPVPFYRWQPSEVAKTHASSRHIVLAELGSLHLEFTRLAQITGEHKYYDAVARITDALEKMQMKTDYPGLWPLKLDASGCKWPDYSATSSDSTSKIEKQVTKPDAMVADPELLNGEEPAILPSDNIGSVGGLTKRDMTDASTESMAENVESDKCEPQGLAYEMPTFSREYGIGGQADSTYEYLPKMHALLRGGNTQYKSMFKDSMKAIREKLLFRPMIKDEKRGVLFPAKVEISLFQQDPSKKSQTKWEGTHLSCFAGGMFALGAKLFDTPSDIDTAKRLTDGCIWAYESMATGIMPEDFELVPCDSATVCPWIEAKWYEALDPDAEERIAAVEAWNQVQSSIIAQAEKESKERPTEVPKKILPDVPEGLYRGRIINADGDDYSVPKVKRASVPDKADDSPTKASAFLYEEEDQTIPGRLPWKPKVALPSEKYAQARIKEERLPPGYTRINTPKYILRPEAIESVWYMWRITGETYWREKGWKMFEAVQAATRTDVGNAGLRDVNSILGEMDDKMESFWLAETLKYFYLLFSEPDVVSLDEYVLNTEAHPFKLINSQPKSVGAGGSKGAGTDV